MSDRHLYIAGTGRAGTTFLVRYLTALGLDTVLARDPQAKIDADAQAGLEDPPSLVDGPGAPYVVKTPWLFKVLDDMLARGQLAADGVIVPMRDLRQAAASRLILEHQAILRETAWVKDLDTPWDVWGSVPGGLIHSMQRVDAERILAVGFHQLIERLVREDVPIVLLSFPRFAADADYLHARLAPVLPQVTLAQARDAFARTAESGTARTETELAGADDEDVRLQNAALKREIAVLQRRLDALEPPGRKRSRKRRWFGLGPRRRG
ncbi:hypothetical protein PQJ75_09360 [Rhodoplanes sp. TEM]|uniref:Sulfotransferase family protein n=1 Tax=Rhodoplanes tepidamans TaxID=200616 RepID=A0ABT5JDE3_RHOTP|nr:MULTISPECIES: hypothetical protein [Rhodoplanes]MDC7787473.1 hypothetical protein [Rhodoplanes tepidamans]MDC7983936.1 hypothetical protein [Rhodoplanes sp. TEM]MDQ0354375.1 hypothetical protein [Rhodoplanes tepidamans]